MLSGFWISKSLSKSEINYIDVMLLFSDTYEEVVGLNVSVKEVS